jgi:hypothetical protein
MKRTTTSKGLILIAVTAMLTGCVKHGGPKLTSIAISPATLTLIAGHTKQLTAVGKYSDGSTKDLTGTATWSSNNSYPSEQIHTFRGRDRMLKLRHAGCESGC